MVDDKYLHTIITNLQSDIKDVRDSQKEQIKNSSDLLLRVEKISNSIDSIEKLDKIQNDQLTYHIKRTDLLEEKVESLEKDLNSDVKKKSLPYDFLNGLLKSKVTYFLVILIFFTTLYVIGVPSDFISKIIGDLIKAI